MGGNRSSMGINREMRRGKRGIFQLECNLSDFLLLFTIEMQLPDVSHQPLLASTAAEFLFPCSSGKEGSTFSGPGCFSRLPVARQ